MQDDLAILDADSLPQLCNILAATDADLRYIIQQYGYPPFWSRPNTFESLVHIILEQQVSLASARASLEKLRERVSIITPENVINLTQEELKDLYVSRQKASYIQSLARAILSRQLDLTDFETLSNETIRQKLLTLRGIGNWTIDIYLIMILHRCDFFPTGDLAVMNAIKRLKQLPRDTSIETIKTIAKTWKPYRSIATMLLWHYYLSTRTNK